MQCYSSRTLIVIRHQLKTNSADRLYKITKKNLDDKRKLIKILLKALSHCDILQIYYLGPNIYVYDHTFLLLHVHGRSTCEKKIKGKTLEKGQKSVIAKLTFLSKINVLN